jgi:hypothetical protein
MVIIKGYALDSARIEEHTFEADVALEPAESGAMMTDHVQPMPVSFTVEGWVSDTPIGAMVAKRAEFALISGEAFARPSDEAFAHLRQIYEDREPVVVETDLLRYDNMIMRSLSIPVDATTGDALMFRAEFVQVRIVQNERVTVRVAVPRASKKKNLGHKTSDLKGDPPPSYMLDENNQFKPSKVGANSGGRRLVGFGGSGFGPNGQAPIASGGGEL